MTTVEICPKAFMKCHYLSASVASGAYVLCDSTNYFMRTRNLPRLFDPKACKSVCFTPLKLLSYEPSPFLQ